MDPISAIGLGSTIIRLTRTVAQTVSYVNDVKEAPVERVQFACEASNLLALRTALRYRVDEAQSETDPWFSSAQKLGQNEGPLSQLQEHLDKVNNKLTKTSKLEAFAKNLVWTLDKKEVKETLSHIERVKGLVSLALENDHFNLSLAIKEKIDQVQVNVETTTLLQQNKNEIEREKILSWLSPLDSISKQHSLYNRRQPGTGDWFLNDPAFTAWLDGTGERILWCPGQPGVGKSSIASLVINRLRAQHEDNETAVSYLFCNYKESGFQTMTNLMAELLCHILQRMQAIPDDVRALYNRHHPKGTLPGVDDVVQILCREVNKYSRVFIVVDALDECPERNSTRWQFLAQLQSLPDNKIRLFCTSRDIPSIKRDFDGSSLLEVRATDDDIKSYLAGRIDAETNHRKKRVLATPGLRDDIIETITTKAQGMFLLAELQMESLSMWFTARDLREELTYLPEGLDDIYEQAMRRIKAQDDEELAILVLSWIVFAFRPLTVRELQHALPVQDDDTDLDPEGIPDEESIVSLCAGLVTIDEESRIIRLVHYITQEYFERQDIRREYFRRAPTPLAEVCLAYLLFTPFSQRFCVSKEELRRSIDELRTKGTGIIAANAPPTLSQLEIAVREGLVRPLDRHPLRRLLPFDPGHQLLLVAARGGHMELVSLLLDEHGHLYFKDVEGEVTRMIFLDTAVRSGHIPLVRFILGEESLQGPVIFSDKGMEFNNLHEAAIYCAAVAGTTEVLEWLLTEGLSDGEHVHAFEDLATLLEEAVRNGRVETIEVLLKHGASLDENLLKLALESRQYRMAKYLVGKGIAINGQTPTEEQLGTGERLWVPGRALVSRFVSLEQAILADDTLLVKQLIQNGETIEEIVHIFDTATTPLQGAVMKRAIRVLRLLLDLGADVNAHDSQDRTPLHWAVVDDYEEGVRLLLDHGACVNSVATGLSSPIHFAAYWSSTPILDCVSFESLVSRFGII